jgi:hypothetical protein
MIGGRRQTKEERAEILRTYLESPEKGTLLAMSKGLSPAYAYKLANMMGVLPKTRWPSRESAA